MPEPNSVGSASRRDGALDVGRGIAVLVMVWVHFVPEPAAEESGWWSLLQAWSVAGSDGLPAAMFLVLLGLAFGVGQVPRSAYVVRRVIALLLLGYVFWHWVWPNDILMPIAIMLLLLSLFGRAASWLQVVLLLAMLASVPVATSLWGGYAWTDVRADGTHEANHVFGWATLRYFVLDGAYPLLPWMVFPMGGLLLANVRYDARALQRCMVASVLAVAIGVLVAQNWGDAEATGLAAMLAMTWQPTSLPFVAVWGGAALLVITVLLRLWDAVALPGWLAPCADIGRTSLTHYLLHTAGVYGALRIWWPEEAWPSSVGVSVALGYVTLAWLLKPRYLQRFRRGPVEALLSFCAGPARR